MTPRKRMTKQYDKNDFPERKAFRKPNVPPELSVPEVVKAEAAAIQAVWDGRASEHQQRVALSVICTKLCRLYSVAYIPGDTNASTLLAGRQFVGRQIMHLLDTNVDNLRDK